MTKELIKSNLIDLCSEIFKESNVDTDLIEYVDYVDDLGMDSITFITLIVEIEARFDIVVPDDMLVIDYFRTTDDIVEIISREMTNMECSKDD